MDILTKIYLGLVIILMCNVYSNASHIRGGEITAEQLSCHGLTFRITLTAYVNLASTIEFGGGNMNFGDGSDLVNPRSGMDLVEFSDLGNGYGRIRFQIEHNFPANGEYTLSYIEPNRNAGIVNMDNSVTTPFYIETMILIDEFECCNSYPVLVTPPTDDACSGVAFFHNPGAWDADGDSLSYELTIPLQSENAEVENYRFPNEIGGNTETGDDPATFKIDPVTGDITWNSPGLAGQYNIAFIIHEWRKFDNQDILLSSITRDMQINVLACDNHRPQLMVPDDICVEAGTLLTEVITGADTDGDSVRIEVFGGPFELADSSAEFSFSPQPTGTHPVSGLFEWQTSCDHIRGQPYQLQIVISEAGENIPPLVTTQAWNVRVLPPSPKGVDLTILSGRRIQLDWDLYSCINAESIQIWRRVDSYTFSTPCRRGIPDSAGYKMIAELDPGITTFVDDNDGNFLDFGALNCYRLVAIFPACGIEASIPSLEVCGLIEAEAPVITHVSIEETDNENGEVFVQWAHPFEINVGSFPPPYFYDLYRADSIDGEDFILIGSDLEEADTIFFDTSINTLDLGYTYFVMLKDANKIPLISSSAASSVRLATSPLPGEIEITWQANVPWSNNIQGFPMHYIYRNHFSTDPDEIVLIDSVNVNQVGFRYLDSGQSNGVDLNENSVHCYYISTRGSYGNPKIKAPLVNDSQIICGQMEDHSPPCIPDLALAITDCEAFYSSLTNCSADNNSFRNELSWTFPAEDSCTIEDLDVYNVYYSHNRSEPYALIGSVIDTEFTHDNLESLAGCYYVTAIDLTGNESGPSPVVCNDNCPGYVLPNVFTPNGDGFNDIFRALNAEDNPDLDPAECPLFVDQVIFRVYNRYGKEVFVFDSGDENNILIGWDGASESGEELPAGIYYYTAQVKYDVIDPAREKVIIKNWVQLLK